MTVNPRSAQDSAPYVDPGILSHFLLSHLLSQPQQPAEHQKTNVRCTVCFKEKNLFPYIGKERTMDRMRDFAFPFQRFLFILGKLRLTFVPFGVLVLHS